MKNTFQLSMAMLLILTSNSVTIANNNYPMSVMALQKEVICAPWSEISPDNVEENTLVLKEEVKAKKIKCKSSFTAEVINIVDVTCFGLEDGQATEVSQGGTPPYSCIWTSGETTITATMLEAGTASVTVTDATGCTTVAVGEVGTPDILELEVVSESDALCNGESNGSATVEGAGGTPGYIYQWPGGQLGATQNNLAAGSYDVTVTDSHDCSEINTVNIGEPDELIMNIISTTDVSCNAGSDGQAELGGIGGIPPYSYLWPDGNTNASRNDLMADSYLVTITDINNCEATENVTIDEPFLLIANTSGTNESSPGAMDGTATANPFGGIQPYSYNWSNGGSTQEITNLSAGDYTVSVTDVNQCISVETVTVETNCSLLISVENDDVACNGDNDGELTVDITGQSDPVTIEWSNGANTETISDLEAGNYSVTVTDENGCSDIIEDAVVTQPDPISVSEDGIENVSCNGELDGSISISIDGGTEGYTFSWSNGETSEDVIELGAGTYDLTVTDANGCETFYSSDITEPGILEANASATNETDNDLGDGTATADPLEGTPPYTYNWSNGSFEQTITDLVPGMYTVTVTDANGCIDVQTVTVESDGCLLGVEPQITHVQCNGESNGAISLVVENANEPVTYEWSNGETSQDISDQTAGNYTVTITDAENCIINLELEITEPPTIDLQVEIIEFPVCSDGDEGILESSASTKGVSFEWSNGQSDAQANTLIAGEYCVTATNQNGCTEIVCLDLVSMDTEPPIAVVKDITLYVDDEGNAPNIVLSDFDNGSSDNCGVVELVETRDPLNCSNLGDNEITFIITDDSDNIASGVFIATVLDTTPPSISVKSIELSADENGNFQAVEFSDIDDGTSDNCDSYTEDFGTLTFNCDDIGDVMVPFKVTDDSGNVSDGEVLIVLKDEIQPEISCSDDFIVNVCDPVDYELPVFSDNCSAMLELVSGPESGTAFMVGVNEIEYKAVDPSGNEAACSFIITVEVDLEIAIETIDVSCFGLSDGQFSYEIEGGTGPYNVILDPEQQDSLAQSAGIYHIIVEDSKGCSILDSIEISQPDQLLVDDSEVVNSTNSNSNDGSISITVIGGTPPYSYNWSKDGEFFSTDEDLTELGGGEYECNVVDANGCELLTEVFTVEVETSILDADFNQSISLYPNPSNDYFTIEVNNLSTDLLEYDIFSTSGSKVMEGAQHLIYKNIEINHNIAPGLYFVRLKSNDKIALKRLIIQN